ncbi:nucleotide sugar dehydrogenase [Candidatus Peregrinibacteria bacterium]|nr:nucleotide sugar dehydrogenase [Candidatus Peregrinibacteria bacterium]
MPKVTKNFRDRRVCIIGLGYVGLTLATVMADQGFDVLGIEIRDEVLDMLKSGNPHFFEPGLSDHLKRLIKEGNIHFEKYIPKECEATVYIITVGTPLDSDGKVRLDMIKNVSEEVSRHLKEGDMVILRSTVKLGLTRKFVEPILKQNKISFDLAFCPERTLEGYALIELRQLPQIIGGLTLESSVRAAQAFQFITPSVVVVNDPETAEMIKLVDNSSRDVFLAYGNEVARMCDAAGISAAEVIRAGKLGYPRTNVAWPGPVGGPCLEKDSHILAEGLREIGIEPEITTAARRLNERQPKEIISQLAKMISKINGFPDKPIITLFGIAFKGKPATDDLRGTMARPIFNEIKKHFPHAHFRGYDAVVSHKAIKEFGLEPFDNIESAINGASLVIILNNHLEFEKMPIEQLARVLTRPAVIYDFWNNFSSRDLHLPEGVKYIALGSHNL